MEKAVQKLVKVKDILPNHHREKELGLEEDR